MASTDGSSTDPIAAQARRRARTAAEQRAERPDAPISNDPEVLAEQIERTREELAETLDAIADKVSPKRVAGRTKQKVGDAVKDGAETAAATVKAGASTLKEAVQDKKQALTGGSDGEPVVVEPVEPVALGEALEDVGADPGAAGAAGVVSTADAVPPTSLRPVPPPPSSPVPLGPPALAGAVAALAVVLLVLRRRRTRSRWERLTR